MLEGLTVVIVGSFNPAIFHPSWLAMNNLIRKEEADEAKIEIIAPEAAIFSAGWIEFQAIPQRLSLHSADPSKQAPLRDLVVGIFTILEHTPVSAFGLNRDRHYKMESEDAWHQFGHFVAPKAPWEGLLHRPGIRTLVMEGQRDQGEDRRVRVKVEPSTKVTPWGVFFNVHQHYKVSPGIGESSTATRLCTLMQSSWQDFMTFSENVTAQLLQKFDASMNALAR